MASVTDIARWSHEAEALAEAVIAKYPQRRSALMPLLFIAMREDGYLSEAGMRRVAELVDLEPAQVISVASFYSMYKRQPVGRYLVSVCTSLSCWLLGGDEVLAAVESAAGVPAGETDRDGLVSPEHVECIGACGAAPAIQVNYELIEGLTPQKATELIDWLKAAKPPTVNGDEMQALFGGRRSFDWGIAETDGVSGPYPAFQPHGTVAAGDPS